MDSLADFSKEFGAEFHNFPLSWRGAVRQWSVACWLLRVVRCQTWALLSLAFLSLDLLSAQASEDGLAVASYNQQGQGKCAQVRKNIAAQNFRREGGEWVVFFATMEALLLGQCRPVWGAALCSLCNVILLGLPGNTFAATVHVSFIEQTFSQSQGC